MTDSGAADLNRPQHDYVLRDRYAPAVRYAYVTRYGTRYAVRYATRRYAVAHVSLRELWRSCAATLLTT